MPSVNDTPVARWQARMGFSDRAAAQALGLSLPGYQANKLERAQGKPRKPARTLLLACAALEAGLAPAA